MSLMLTIFIIFIILQWIAISILCFENTENKKDAKFWKKESKRLTDINFRFIEIVNENSTIDWDETAKLIKESHE